MHYIISRITLVCIFLWACSPAHASNSDKPEKLDQLVQLLEDRMQDVQGGAMAIIYKGKVVYQTTFGHCKGTQGEITSDTLFALASVSKPISAMAIALLVDKGQLKLDQKFTLPQLKNPVTLKNLLSHTTGYNFPGNHQIEKGIGRKKLLDKLKEQKPKCTPGGCYTYSNATFSLVEDALAKKGIKFSSVIANLSKALNTNGIQLAPVGKGQTVAYPHKDTEDGLKSMPLPPYYPKATPASAGMFASLNGMIEFYKLSFGYRPDLISQETIDLVQKPFIKNQDHENWGLQFPCDIKQIQSFYGLGWRIFKDKKKPGKDMIFHGGHLSGISTFIGFIPSEEIGVIILLNQGAGANQAAINFWQEVIS